MTRLAIKRGEKADELRRLKEKSRKTQAFLSESKKVVSSTLKAEGTASPERSMKANTIVSGQASTVSGGQSKLGRIVVDLLLFGHSGHLKKGMSMT